MRTITFIFLLTAAGMLATAGCQDKDRSNEDVPQTYRKEGDSAHSLHEDVNDDGTIIHPLDTSRKTD